jgi:signal transduction histidine kinase
LSIARLGLRRVGSSSSEKLESYFKMIVTSGDQVLALLSDLLDLSTLESSRPSYHLREYDLARDLDRMVSEFKAMMAEKEIFLSYQSDVSVALARYDRTKLYQVVGNLLANAMKFTAPQKEVKVLLQNDFIETNGEQQAAWKVMVIDQGIGVEQNELESVFGKFVKGSKTSRGVSGVGLGLSICKRIVEDHNGIIWAEPNELEGAIFCFLLPALE